MNFHPDKQLFQVAGAVDRTTDPWIRRPELYPYTTGDSLINNLKPTTYQLKGVIGRSSNWDHTFQLRFWELKISQGHE